MHTFQNQLSKNRACNLGLLTKELECHHSKGSAALSTTPSNAPQRPSGHRKQLPVTLNAISSIFSFLGCILCV